MPMITWGETGQRFFETGLDRGVLYPLIGDGVPWDGLISVSESPTGGAPTPYYYDGYKYLNLSSSEEFEATISAYSAPPEFHRCDGSASIGNGLFVTQQPRQTFGMSYRTRIGNDIDGPNHGYKIHLIYNALSSPSARNNSSISNTPAAMTLSWKISTRPPKIGTRIIPMPPGKLIPAKPTSHFVIDSRYTPSDLLEEIEGILYGNDTDEARLPSVTEILNRFTLY